MEASAKCGQVQLLLASLWCYNRVAGSPTENSGHFGSFLGIEDGGFQPNAERPFHIHPIHALDEPSRITEFVGIQEDVLQLSPLSPELLCICHVVYIDPPYNGRQYSKLYHVLRLLCVYDLREIKVRDDLMENAQNFLQKGSNPRT